MTQDRASGAAVKATWDIYQRMIAAYRHPDRVQGRQLMTDLIGSISSDIPRNLTNYIARSLLEAGGFRPALHPRL